MRFTPNKNLIRRFFSAVLCALFLSASVFPAAADPLETAVSSESEALEAESTAEDTAEETPEAAPEEDISGWPDYEGALNAGSACVIDADTGEILFARNEHAKGYPASITKILTALIVCENCSFSEEVTFSEAATTHLESGAVTIGTAAGDVLTVEECLYALLLKSANEVANALAEHVAGSTEAFCGLMNEKAAALGCVDSDFHNANGLTNSAHVTSAYDMALIAAACMNNAAFMEIEKSTSYHISHTAQYPDGLTVAMGHKMLGEGAQYYDARVKAGKTGFTSASGNTLVTMAEHEGRRVCVAVLKDSNPGHYQDTRALLDFAYENFTDLYLGPDKVTGTFDIEKELLSAGTIEEGNWEISLAKTLILTVPKEYDPGKITLSYDYALPKDAPELAVAIVRPSYEDRTGTGAYVFARDLSRESDLDVDGPENGEKESTKDASGDPSVPEGPGFTVDVRTVLTFMGILGVAGIVFLVILAVKKKKRDEQFRLERIRKRRAERLRELGMTEEEFLEELRKNRAERLPEAVPVPEEDTPEETSLKNEAEEDGEPADGGSEENEGTDSEDQKEDTEP